MQRLRARSSAILTGIGTVLADDPQMNVRLAEALRQPLRVILDTELRTPPMAKILQPPDSALIFTAVSDAVAQAPLRAAGADMTFLAFNEVGVGLAEHVWEALEDRSHPVEKAAV